MSMAERSVQGSGCRGVERVPAAVAGGVARQWRQEVCGAGGGVRWSGWCAASDAGVRGTRPEPLSAGWLRAVMVGS